MGSDTFGFIAVIGFILAIAFAVSCSRLPNTVKLLVYAALALRVLGAWGRYTVLWELYGGRGDARGYYNTGVRYAEMFWRLDFSPFVNPDMWLRGKWWGTQFVHFPSGIVLSIIGPDMLGEFVVFSLLAFLGLVGFAVAFRRSYPHVPLWRYARWIWLFPSLWYWPSIVGKESLMMLGIGLTIWGFIGKRDRVNWPLLAIGLFFCFAIRPQVAAVIFLSLVIGYWLSLGTRWTGRKVLQGAVILALGLGGIHLSMSFIGVDGFDVEGVQTYMEGESGSGSSGGSGIEAVEIGWRGVPMALVNILFRPFPWEAHNLQSLVSGIEIWAFWGIVWWRRRKLVQTLRHWRADRFLTLAVPFILIYSITLGMVVANLGIIARQRVFLFPFLFLLLEAVPRPRRPRVPARPPIPVPEAERVPLPLAGGAAAR